MDVKRDQKAAGIRVFPETQVDLPVVTDHPTAHHVDLLVGGLQVGFLTVDPDPYLILGKALDAGQFLINGFQP